MGNSHILSKPHRTNTLYARSAAPGFLNNRLRGGGEAWRKPFQASPPPLNPSRLDRNLCPTNLGTLIILRERKDLSYLKTFWALLLSGELPSGQDSLGCALTWS
jgi:hypothetical protein